MILETIMLKFLLIFCAFAAAFNSDVRAQSDTSFVLQSALWPMLSNANRPTNDSNGSTAINASEQRDFVPLYPIFVPSVLPFWRVKNGNTPSNRIINQYLVTPGIGAHKLHIRKLTWNKARKLCVEEGAQLAIINSPSEEKILTRILEENKVDRAWLGIHDLYEEGDWVTLLGQSIEAAGFDLWSKKYPVNPDNYNNRQHCGSLEPTGMDDIDCSTLLSFICEIPA